MNDTDRINFLEHLLARKRGAGRAICNDAEFTFGLCELPHGSTHGYPTMREAIDAAYQRFMETGEI